MTNGDAGHFEMHGAKLGQRRKRECRNSAKIIGARSVVFDNHDGHLRPTLKVRKDVVRAIREAEADVVITHRPNDYHPDHRYTAQVVQDAAYMVTVPFFDSRSPYLDTNPVFMYFMDRFQKPYPFQADVAIAIDDTMNTKWSMLNQHESQVYEWLAWHAGLLETVPNDNRARLKWLKKTWGPYFREPTKRAQKSLVKYYGKSRGERVRFAELFEICEYGRRPSKSEIYEIFPFLPPTRSGRRKL